jgi:5'-nucleotidase
MLSTNTKVILSLLVGIPVLLGLAALVYRLVFVKPPTPLTLAPDNALSVLHYNDGYDVRRTPRFLTRWLERLESETLTLFSGDIISPSLVSNYMKGDQFVPFMEYSKTRVAVPGNHEYDFGEEQFEGFIKHGSTHWIVANMKAKGDPSKSLSGLEEHHVVTLNGHKVGIFGLVDTNWLGSNKLDTSKYDYEPFDEAAKRKSAELKKLGCVLVFVVSHMGNESDDKVLSDQNDVDMVFGGHDHIFYVRRVNDKLLLKSGTEFENFSQTKLFFTATEPKDYFCNEACGVYEFLLDEDINDDQVFFNFTLPRGNQFLNVVIEKVKVVAEDVRHPGMASYIKEKVDPVIGSFLSSIARLDSRLDTRETIIKNRETAVGNLFADLAKAYYGTDIGIVNAGIFKAEKLYQGNTFLRKFDLMKIFPYKRDVFVTLDITGNDILAALEQSLKNFPKPNNNQFLSFSGLSYSLLSTGEPGSRVVPNSVRVNGVPLDPEKEYSVAMVSGLTDARFGLDILKGREFTNDVKTRLEPGALFEAFTDLAKASENVHEFEAFRQQFPDVSLVKIASAHVKPSEKGNKRFTFDSGSSGNLLAQMEKLNPEALQRLRLYTLVSKVVNSENHNIWAIKPTVENRFKLVRKLDV